MAPVLEAPGHCLMGKTPLTLLNKKGSSKLHIEDDLELSQQTNCEKNPDLQLTWNNHLFCPDREDVRKIEFKHKFFVPVQLAFP